MCDQGDGEEKCFGEHGGNERCEEKRDKKKSERWPDCFNVASESYTVDLPMVTQKK